MTSMWAKITFKTAITSWRPNVVHEESNNPQHSVISTTRSITLKPITYKPISSSPPSTIRTTIKFTVSHNNPFLFTSAPKVTTTIANRNSEETECGQSLTNIQHLVIGGQNVREGQFPWLVALMYRQNSNYKYRCAGTLVSDRHIITGKFLFFSNFFISTTLIIH